MRIRPCLVLLALFGALACAGAPAPSSPRAGAPPQPPALPAAAPAPVRPVEEDALERAEAALAAGNRDAALKAFREALDRLPQADARYPGAAQAYAQLLSETGRHGEAAAFLSTLSAAALPEARRLAAQELETLGRDREAVDAYVEAEALADATSRDELSARARALVDRLGEEDLASLARLRPYSRHGGYAGLRLARLDAQRGKAARSAASYRRLAFLFPNDPVGKAAREELPPQAAPPRPTAPPAPPAAAPATVPAASPPPRAVPAATPASGQDKPGVFGLLLPLTGNLAPLGDKALRGALLGFGLLAPGASEALSVLVADTQSDPTVAVKGVESLAARGALGIIGPLKGDVAQAAAGAARALGVPLLTLTPAADVAGGGVYRLALREEDEVEAVARYAVESLGIRRFAILAPDTEAGARYRNLFWDAAVRHGAEIAGSETFSTPDTRALEAPIHRLSGMHNLSRADLRERYQWERLMDPLTPPDPSRDVPEKYKPRPVVDFGAVFVPAPSLSAAQIAPLFPYYDVDNVRLLGLRSWNYAGFVQVGKKYVEGAVFPTEWSPSTPEGQAFQRAFQAAYGEPPGLLEAFGYDAAALFLAAHRGGQAASRAALSRTLSRLGNIQAVTGPLSSTPEGDIAVTPKLLTVERQQIVPAP